MTERMLISFSGGRTSAFMTKYLLEKYGASKDIVVVFANTGMEREETLEFVKRCSEAWGWDVVWIEAITNPEQGKGIRAKVVDFATASRRGEPFEQMIAKHGIPNMGNPFCSRELKKYAVQAYCRSIGWKANTYQTAIGIRADESSRINLDSIKNEGYYYPLAHELRITKSDINAFWSKQPFDLELRSYEGNCSLCWKKSLRKLMTIVRDRPELADWWREMERKYEGFVPERKRHNKSIKVPLRFFRENMTIDEIIEESKLPFTPARDESGDIDMWNQMAMWDEGLDGNNGCSESCEAA